MHFLDGIEEMHLNAEESANGKNADCDVCFCNVKYFHFSSSNVTQTKLWSFLQLLEFNVFEVYNLIQVKVFWVVMPYNVAVGYQHYKGPSCLHLPSAR
jgi:hypothetical protein